MLDPLSASAITAVLAGVFNGATEEAGASGLRSFTQLVRRRAVDEGDPPEAVERWIEQPSVHDLAAVAEYVSAAAATDAPTRGALEDWNRAYGGAVMGPVTNNATGTFHGSVIQAGIVQLPHDSQ